MLLKNPGHAAEPADDPTHDPTLAANAAGLRAARALFERVRPRAVAKHFDLATRRDVRKRLHRDRLLADRTGRRFATVVFGVDSRAAAVRLAEIVKVRKRETDEFGPAPRELCGSLGRPVRHCYVVVLPETGRDGAQRFADSVAARLAEIGRSVYRVAVYPEAAAGEDRSLRECDAPGAFERGLPIWKRGLDLLVASAGALLLAPLMGLIAVMIRLDSPGPALFWQARTGRGGRTFHIAKFRTMVVDAERVMAELNLRAGSEQDGPAFKLRRDPRVTKFGRLLRQTSLDELPQLWNILRGDMTLVGPRPLPVCESDAIQPWQRRRLDVTPGLTCIWQVHGRSRVLFDDWMRMDLRYVKRSEGLPGVLHDATLLAKTLPAVFLKRGF